MTAALRVADQLALPADAVTQTFAFLARRGAGKTYAGSVLAEELIAAGFPVVILDPVGVWWGLRSAYPVVILGGPHGDLPLDSHAGRPLADWLIRERRPTIFDLSRFGEGEMVRFVADLADEFYRKTDGTPTHWILDEADEFAPQGGQTTGGAMPACLGAVQRLTRRGRARGIGVTVITQRSAVLNKSVLTQTEVLVAMQMTAPQDIAAVEEWWKYQGDKASREEVVSALPGLGVGEAVVYSPGWLRQMKRVKFRKRLSFDSSATPKAGEKPRKPPSLESLDLDALQVAIGEAAEQVKANDPVILKKKIADLEKQLRERPAAEPKVVEVPALTPDQERAIAAAVDEFKAAAEKVGHAISLITQAKAAVRPSPPIQAPKVVQSIPTRTAAVAPPSGDLTGPQQAILDTVLMLNARGIPATRDCVARWLGIHPNGGSYGANLGRLRSEGYLDGFHLTDRGKSSARPQPTGLEAALSALPNEPTRKIIRTVVDAGDSGLTRDELAGRLGLHPHGGSYGANLGWLRTMGLLTERGPIRATDGLLR